MSGPGRGKPVLISILNWYSRHNFRTLNENRHLKKKQCSAAPVGVVFFTCLLHVVAEKVVTDGQTDGRKDGQTDKVL